MSAVCQTCQLHLPLLAASLHLQCWSVIRDLCFCHFKIESLLNVICKANTHTLVYTFQLISMQKKQETCQHCLMLGELWVSYTLYTCCERETADSV